MTTRDPKPGAADCLRHGCAQVRANPELLALGWLQQVVTLGLTFAGFWPLASALAPLGVRWEALVGGDPASAADELTLLLTSLPQAAGGLLLALLPASALWLLAALVFCWFQAGIYGVLYAAEGNLGGGAGGETVPEAVPWRAFRAFGWRRFATHARRWTWRYAGYLHLWLLVASLVLLLQSLVFTGAVTAGERAAAAGSLDAGSALGLGIAAGCGGALLLGLPLWIVAAAGFWLGQADLPRPDSGVRPASWLALRLLRYRPGDVALLFAAYLGSAAAAGLLLAPLAALAGSGRSSTAGGLALAGLLLPALELLVAVALTTAFAGATVTLAWGEVAV